jgi:hypothetical protein
MGAMEISSLKLFSDCCRRRAQWQSKMDVAGSRSPWFDRLAASADKKENNAA